MELFVQVSLILATMQIAVYTYLLSTKTYPLTNTMSPRADVIGLLVSFGTVMWCAFLLWRQGV